MKKIFALLCVLLLVHSLVAQEDCDDVSGDITPASATICQGGSTTLTATGGDTYTWFRDGIEITGETASTLNATEAGTYSVTIHEGECSVAASNTSTITQAPTPTGTISPSNASFCQGGSTTLTATGGDSYTWFFDGVEISGEDDETLNVNQAGTYTVTIHQGDCSGPASNSSTVTVASAPTGTISPATASFCTGGSTTLTATGGDSYTWFRNGNQINGEDEATITVNQAGTYTVTIHQDDCSGPASNSSTVTVASAPTGTISPATTSFCPGGSATLTATGGDSYTWFRNGNQINGEDEATITVNQTGTYTVTIHQGDCSGPASNSATVSSASAPTGTISPANASICQGGSTTLTATGGSSYTWFRNGNEINGEDEATLNADQPGVYSVTIHQGNCSGPATNTSTVTVTSAPTGNITPATAAVCEGEAVTLTATGGTSYSWFRNGNEIDGQTSSTLNVTQAGTYSAIVRQGECNGDAANTAVVTSKPAPSGTISPANASICQGGSTTLTATGGTSYTWFRNGNQINGQTGATLNVTQGGTYSVTINDGECSAPADNDAVVLNLPVPIGNVSPATGSICDEGSLTLTATGGSSYAWFRNGNEIEGQTGATLEVTQAGTYTAIISQGSCSAPALNGSIVTKSAAPTGSISPASGSICGGGSVLLTASGGSSYEWFRDGVSIPGETGATLDVTQAGTYTATIKQGTCVAPASNSVEINEASAPSGTISPATAAICEGGSVALTATGGSSYTWSHNGNVLPGQTGPTINVSEAGNYSVTINQGNCTGPASNIAVVSVASAPTGTISPASAAICAGGSQVLTATGGTTYTWMRNDEVIAGETAATLTVTEAGTYSVIITNGSCVGPAQNTATVTAESLTGTKYADVNTTPGVPIQLEARDIGVTYEWTPATDLNNPAARVPTVIPSNDAEYVVKITTASGCVIADTVFVRVRTVIVVPTAFTPNRNGVNDQLRPLGAIRSIDYFKVFNRWGQMVFQTTQIGHGWDGIYKGADQPSDTYTWVLAGIAADGKPVKLTGKTLLIR